MFTSQFFQPTGDNFIDAFNAKASAHALGDKVLKRQRSPARATPVAHKSLKTIEVIPYRFFKQHDVRHTSEGSWTSSESSAPEDSSSEDDDDVHTLLRCTSSLGSRLASSDETMQNLNRSVSSSSLSAISVAETDNTAASAPASIGMAMCEAQVMDFPAEEMQEDAPAVLADDLMNVLENTLDAELNVPDVFELPDGHVFHGTRSDFHDKLWGNPEWRDECAKEMTPEEYLRMLRTHDPKGYTDTLLVLNAIAYDCE